MSTQVATTVAPDGTPYARSSGCTELGYPELTMRLPHEADEALQTGMGVVLTRLVSHQIARAAPFTNGEVVDVLDLGIRARMRDVTDGQARADGFAIIQVVLEDA
jgi:hypothetical protein